MTDAAIAKKRAAEALAYDETQAHDATCSSGMGEWCGGAIRFRRTTSASGDVALDIEGGLSCSAGVIDGVGFQIDELGASGVLELANLEEVIVTTAVAESRWLSPSSPLALAIVSVDADNIVLSVRAHVEASVTYHLTLDARTHLPLRLVRAGRDDASVRFDDFHRGHFARVPRRVTVREAWLEDVFVTDTVERVAEVPRPSIAGPGDATFAEDTMLVAQRSTRRKLPVVRACVDGVDVGWFLLDTGAGALALDGEIVAARKLAGKGRRIVRTSTDVVGAPIRRAEKLAVGDLAITAPLFLELEMEAFGRALGVKLAGVLGYDVFRRSVVVIDGGERVEIRPSAPAHATRWMPLRYEDRRPVVTLRLPGPEADREALFAIDTGSAAALTIYSGAAKLFLLRGGARTSLRGIGDGGGARARTVAWAELDGYRFEDVDVLVAEQGSGVTGESAVSRTGRGVVGSIGMGVLRDVTMVLDYAQRRVSFARRSRATLRARAR